MNSQESVFDFSPIVFPTPELQSTNNSFASFCTEDLLHLSNPEQQDLREIFAQFSEDPEFGREEEQLEEPQREEPLEEPQREEEESQPEEPQPEDRMSPVLSSSSSRRRRIQRRKTATRQVEEIQPSTSSIEEIDLVTPSGATNDVKILSNVLVKQPTCAPALASKQQSSPSDARASTSTAVQKIPVATWLIPVPVPVVQPSTQLRDSQIPPSQEWLKSFEDSELRKAVICFTKKRKAMVEDLKNAKRMMVDAENDVVAQRGIIAELQQALATAQEDAAAKELIFQASRRRVEILENQLSIMPQLKHPS